LLLGLLLLWIIANVVMAMFRKAEMGGGFWGLANWITKSDRNKDEDKDKLITALETQLAAARAEALAAKQAEKSRSTEKGGTV
jgi:hypothetical protein